MGSGIRRAGHSISGHSERLRVAPSRGDEIPSRQVTCASQVADAWPWLGPSILYAAVPSVAVAPWRLGPHLSFSSGPRFCTKIRSLQTSQPFELQEVKLQTLALILEPPSAGLILARPGCPSELAGACRAPGSSSPVWYKCRTISPKSRPPSHIPQWIWPGLLGRANIHRSFGICHASRPFCGSLLGGVSVSDGGRICGRAGEAGGQSLALISLSCHFHQLVAVFFGGVC